MKIVSDTGLWSGLWFGRLRLWTMSRLALPIVAGVIATNAMSVIDTAMVGQLGETALAGVGLAGQLFFLMLAVLLGISAGVQSMVARRVGEQRLDQAGRVLNAGILLATLVGLFLLLGGYLLIPVLLPLINYDPEVVAGGLSYLDPRLPSLLIIGVNIAFRSYWVGVSLAKWSMVSILTLSVANVVFNYLLIFGHFGFPEMGVAGAGLGSTLAVGVGLLVNIGFALRLAVKNGFLAGLPPVPQVVTLVKVSAPESVRQVFFSIGVVVFYLLVGQIGTTELAVFHVVLSICLIAFMPHIGLGGAATTLVSEALGRQDVADARLWGWQVSNAGALVLTLFGILILCFPEPVLKLFLTEPATVNLAVVPLQLGVLAHILMGYSNIMGSALIGAGATRTVMVLSSALQWLVFLPLLGLCVYLGYGLHQAFSLFLAYSLLSALLFVMHWQNDRWSQISI